MVLDKEAIQSLAADLTKEAEAILHTAGTMVLRRYAVAKLQERLKGRMKPARVKLVLDDLVQHGLFTMVVDHGESIVDMTDFGRAVLEQHKLLPRHSIL